MDTHARTHTHARACAMQAVYWITLKAQGPQGLGPPWTPSAYPPWAQGPAAAGGINSNISSSNSAAAQLDGLVLDLVLTENEKRMVHRGR